MANIPVLTHIKLSSPQVVVLQALADPARGGRMPWNLDNPDPRVQQSQEMAKDMILKQVVRYVEYVTHAGQPKGRTYLELTDVGRRALVQIDEAAKKRVHVEQDVNLVAADGGPIKAE